MKYFLFVFLLLPLALFASTFQAITFDSDASALALVTALESRVPHSPGWTYCDHASPTIHLTDGRKALVIVDSIKPYLTPEELALVVEIDSSLIPPPPPSPW
jgi:hypothetical protein